MYYIERTLMVKFSVRLEKEKVFYKVSSSLFSQSLRVYLLLISFSICPCFYDCVVVCLRNSSPNKISKLTFDIIKSRIQF